MVKRIGSVGTLLGGLLGLIGSIGAVVTSVSIYNAARSVSSWGDLGGLMGKAQTLMNFAVLMRVAAIVLLVAGIIAIAGAVMEKSGMGAQVAGMIFAVVAFIGQFLINPLTSTSAAASSAGTDTSSLGGQVLIGVVLIAVSGLVSLIVGIVGAAKKSN